MEATQPKSELISRDKLKLLPKEEQAQKLKDWRKQYETNEIVNALGISKQSYYQLCSYLGITNGRGGSRKKKDNNKPKTEKKSTPAKKTEKVEEPSGLTISYEGNYSSKEVVNRLEKLSLLLDDEKRTYEVEIKITEK